MNPVENELSPVLSEYRRMQIVSIGARPYRSPERAEDQAADGPRDQEHRRRIRTVFQCELRVGDQVFHGRVARQVEDLQVETIERPGKGSAGEDEPLFASSGPATTAERSCFRSRC